MVFQRAPPLIIGFAGSRRHNLVLTRQIRAGVTALMTASRVYEVR